MKLINEIIPQLSVLADYAKKIGYPFNTYHQIKVVISHYKNYGSQLN